MMTADKLQEVVLRLSNAAWVRYWLKWPTARHRRWTMAVQARDHEGRPVRVLPLDTLGFDWDADDRIHFIDRTNDDGTPFRSVL